MTIHGNFFDSRSSSRHEAVLRFYAGEGRLSVYDAAGACLAEAGVSVVNISSRVGNTPRFLHFPDGGVFETRDNDAIDRLAKTLNPRAGLPHRLESRLRYAVIGLVVVILFTWVSIQYGIPFCAYVAAFAISAENNRRIGQGVLESLDKMVFAPSELPVAEQERLRRRFLDFLGKVDNIPLAVEFRDTKGSLGANALTLPSGTIVFTDQLVKLAKNDEELLSVFAHEAGHVERRHAMRGILQQSALAAVIVAVTGDVSTVSSFVAAAPVFLVQTGYSRDFEREADDFAVTRLREAKIDPKHFADMLTRLEESRHKRGDQDNVGKTAKTRTEESLPKPGDQTSAGKTAKKDDGSTLGDYLSTHPATAERLKRIAGQ